VLLLLLGGSVGCSTHAAMCDWRIIAANPLRGCELPFGVRTHPRSLKEKAPGEISPHLNSMKYLNSGLDYQLVCSILRAMDGCSGPRLWAYFRTASPDSYCFHRCLLVRIRGVWSLCCWTVGSCDIFIVKCSPLEDSLSNDGHTMRVRFYDFQERFT